METTRGRGARLLPNTKTVVSVDVLDGTGKGLPVAVLTINVASGRERRSIWRERLLHRCKFSGFLLVNWLNVPT